MRKAIVAGHICIDITPTFSENCFRGTDLGEFLKPGRLIQTGAPNVHTGGAVANTGLGMKVLGAEVRLIGMVGRDAFGGMTQSILVRYGADVRLIEEKDAVTSYSVVLAVPGIDRIFLHCPGANDLFDGARIPDSDLEDASLFHFGYPTLMRKMYADGGESLSALFARMKNRGMTTSLDMAAVDPESDAGRADWKEILRKTLPQVDFFVPSFEELVFMLDREKHEQLRKKAAGGDMTRVLSLEEDIRPLAEQCLELGAKAVLIKCGAPGMFLMTSDRMQEAGTLLAGKEAAWNGFVHFEKSYRVDQVLSGTGAGDVSIAAFLTSVMEGADPGTALENAAAAGALCCMSYDAISGLRPLKEIRALIDQGWKKTKE